jgi:hypothetical protein
VKCFRLVWFFLSLSLSLSLSYITGFLSRGSCIGGVFFCSIIAFFLYNYRLGFFVELSSVTSLSLSVLGRCSLLVSRRYLFFFDQFHMIHCLRKYIIIIPLSQLCHRVRTLHDMWDSFSTIVSSLSAFFPEFCLL